MSTTGPLRFELLIPQQLVFLGADMFVQAFALAPGANAAEIVTSDALHWVFGDV